LRGKKIATELVNFTTRYLKERDIEAQIDFSWGATEAKVVEGLADAAVELTETGSTIRAHGLRIICDILYTHTHLIANRDAMADPTKRKKIDQISMLLQAALTARHKVLIKMNIPKERVDDILATLPSQQSPTVNHLYKSEWLAVESMVDRHEVRDLIPQLKAMGAEGILEHGLEKVV
ncbi:MAG: ATP phosphoribosyltransferase, partial [Magnetococcales bacterium]|nr:ATP phosphoribosyltransferase [Magnetococcales bacterium]